MPQEEAAFGAVGLQRVPSADNLLGVRTLKQQVRVAALERQTLTGDALANPTGIATAWQQWEAHRWSPTLTDPWQASYAHIGPPVPAVTPPPPPLLAP